MTTSSDTVTSQEQLSVDSVRGGDSNGRKRPLPDGGQEQGGGGESVDGGGTGDDASAGDGSNHDYELDPDKRREVRKMRRVMANRRSARESRERRKKLLTDLQESVENLTSENASLTKENLQLRRELASLIEQAGGAAALSSIPNIQGLLQGTQGLSGLTSFGNSGAGDPPQK